MTYRIIAAVAVAATMLTGCVFKGLHTNSFAGVEESRHTTAETATDIEAIKAEHVRLSHALVSAQSSASNLADLIQRTLEKIGNPWLKQLVDQSLHLAIGSGAAYGLHYILSGWGAVCSVMMVAVVREVLQMPINRPYDTALDLAMFLSGALIGVWPRSRSWSAGERYGSTLTLRSPGSRTSSDNSAR